MIDLLGFIVIGIISGWLAGKLTKGKGFGLTVNLIIGIIGSLLGGFLFKILGFSSDGIIASIIVSTVGAILTLYLVNRIKENI